MMDASVGLAYPAQQAGPLFQTFFIDMCFRFWPQTPHHRNVCPQIIQYKIYQIQ